jgi:branched-chain amino acid transport system ATP-binding protein
MLSISGLSAYYGKIEAIRNISMEVVQKEVVTILGANGAGKTTILKSILGVIRRKTGQINFKSQSIDTLRPESIVRLGISMVPEGRRIFPEFTVLENLQIGAYSQRGRKIGENLSRIFEIFPILQEKTQQKGITLSGGQQQMLAIGRALMAKPELLLLDEPSLGLAPMMIREVFALIKAINDQGTTILLVEQNVEQALAISNSAYIMENGNIVSRGNPTELLADDNIRKSYLGF